MKRSRKVVVGTEKDREIVEQAATIAQQYRITIDEVESGKFLGTVTEMRGIQGEGETAQACFENTRYL